MPERETPRFGEYESKVLRTLPGSNSVRTTVPQVIANLLEAAPDTTLIWSFDKEEGTAIVRLKRETAGKKSSKRD